MLFLIFCLGAYGYVKMAFRNSDRLLVISKFILKEKLCSNFMITTEDKKEIPMEIYLLRKVNHPNIVTVLDVYENEVSLKSDNLQFVSI